MIDREPVTIGDDSSSHRTRMLQRWIEDQNGAIAAGDLEAARIAHEAIGKLLGAPANPAAVADLAAERTKRGGR